MLFTNGITLYFAIASLIAIKAQSPPMEMVQQRQLKLLMEHIEILNEFNEFDNFILYRTPDEIYEVPLNRSLLMKNQSAFGLKSVGDMITNYMFTSQLRKPIMSFSIKPWDYLNNTKSIPKLGLFLTNRNLVIVVIHDIYDQDVKEFVAYSLGASLETKLIFLLIGQELTDTLGFVRLEKLTRFFHWCWSKNILNVILLFQRDGVVDLYDITLEVYTYTPFPKPIKLLQLTNEHPRNYFVDRTLDLMGYEFRIPVFHDKPNVFKVYNPHLGREVVTGIAGHLYVEFVKKINGTFTEITRTRRFSRMILYQNDLLIARSIDIGIHPFSYMIPNKFYGSYPITNTNSCVIVPVIPEIFQGFYILITLNQNMWILLLIMFTVFHFTYILINKLTYGQWQHWDALSITLQGILNMPLGNIYHDIAFSRLTSKRKWFIHMLLMATGMLYNQIYIAALTSFLSTTLYGKQLETLEDLQQANVSIMTLDYLFFTYKLLDIIPKEFASSVMIADVDTVSRHLNSFNTSYAYIVLNEEWKVLQSLQQNLLKPRFKMAPNLCITNIYLSLPMQFNSPFYHTLQNFILTVQETGLEQTWTDSILWNIRQTTSGSVALTENIEHPSPLNLTHFTVMWIVFIMGMMFALLAFVCEKIFILKLNK